MLPVFAKLLDFWRSHRWPWSRRAKAEQALQIGIEAFIAADLRKAVANLEKARQLLKSLNEQKLLAMCENTLGNAYKLSNEPALALAAYSRARALHQAIKDLRGEAADIANS